MPSSVPTISACGVNSRNRAVAGINGRNVLGGPTVDAALRSTASVAIRIVPLRRVFDFSLPAAGEGRGGAVLAKTAWEVYSDG